MHTESLPKPTKPFYDLLFNANIQSIINHLLGIYVTSEILSLLTLKIK
jgi:hypothetical protein